MIVSMGDLVYQAFNQVKICDMNRKEYCDYRNWEIPLNVLPSDEGYLIEHMDTSNPNDSRHAGYITWLTKAEFMECFEAVPTHNLVVNDSGMTAVH